MFSIISDTTSMRSSNQISSATEDKNTIGMSGKFGMKVNNFRYYASITYSNSTSILASFDYLYSLNEKMQLFYGLSAGLGQYYIDRNSLISKTYGIQLGIRYLDYELSIQKMSAPDNRIINSIKYEIDDILLLSINYHF